MANGTQNVFFTNTKNRFFPLVQAFSDNLYKYSEAQTGLNEKLYTFAKDKEGRQFLDTYGTRIREAKTPEELSKITTEAIQYGSTRGLQNQLSVLGALSQGQGNTIKLAQDKEKAGLYVDMISNQLKGATVNYGGNPMTDITAAMDDIISKTQDPTTQVQLLDQLVKGVNQNVEGLVKGKDGQYYVSPGVVNPITNEMISSGEPISIGSVDGKDFLDVNKNKQFDAGEKYINPKTGTDLTRMRAFDKEQAQQNARLFGDRSWVTVINKDTQKPESLRMDFQGNLYTANNEPIKDASKYDITNKSALTSEEEKLRLGDVDDEEKKLVKIASTITDKIELYPSAKSKFLSGDGVNTSATGKKYMTTERLKQVIGIIQYKKNKGESLTTAEQQFVDSGAYNVYWEDYKPQAMVVEKVGEYQTENVKKVIGYEDPTKPKALPELSVIKEGVFHYATDEKGQVILDNKGKPRKFLYRQEAEDEIRKRKAPRSSSSGLQEGI